ncbi:MAG: glycoside hydrolase family 11 protein, partial [Treponema sp.]|nr:glycoside hydrolase family 11 protein [Treponema sp.]
MKKGKTALYTGFLLVFVFVLISTSCGGCSGGNPGIKNEFDFDNKVWVDPSAQVTQLTGGETLLPYSGGSKKLPGTPYSYDTWEWSEGKKVSNSKFIWYGANQGGGGAFRAEWNDYLHARLGFYWGHGGEYTKYKNMYVDYNYNRSDNVSTPTGFIGVYGWFLSPSASISSEKVIEYYITDDWFWDRQLDYMQIVGGAETVKELGSFTVDGAVYKIYQSTRVYEPSVFGQTTFTQIFSVRQGRRTYGTISVTEHFNAWRKYLKLDSIYEVTFFVEAAFDDIGNGYLDLTYLYLSQET